jgi:pSer/pThr/pTyr-binding forkhead associated (FHA) protein
MLAKLKVIHGASAGKEIKITCSPFVIGRADECHLRPKSDAISRRHCELIVQGDQLILRDLGSKNGTEVNGDRIQGERPLKLGDHLKMGPLEFEVLIDVGFTGQKNSKVESVQDAVGRTGESSVVDSDISAWLMADSPTANRSITSTLSSETRQFRLEETDKVDLKPGVAPETSTASAESAASAGNKEAGGGKAESSSSELKKPEKKEPGKLPPRAEAGTANSRDAAADALKKFFNRR